MAVLLQPGWHAMRHVLAVAAIAFAACTHTEPFTTAANAVGPFRTGADQRLTLKPDQDYWPTWTQDGKGILYAYVDDAAPKHRCLGILPAIGGTRLWERCDKRSTRGDSTTGYSAYALDSTGHLLVAEAVTRTGFTVLPTVSLGLADTAHPYVRTMLAKLPLDAGSTTVTWLSELTWIGRDDFLAPGQQIILSQHCLAPCAGEDSLFSNAGVVLRGTISGGAAALSAIAGTDSATAYALAAGGGTLLFTRPHDLTIYQVPLAGGTPTPPPPVRTLPDTAALLHGEITGIACRMDQCVFALSGVLPTATYMVDDPIVGWEEKPIFATTRAGVASGLYGFTIGVSDTTLLVSGALYASPAISPANGALVVQVGGPWGWLQSVSTATSDLHRGCHAAVKAAWLARDLSVPQSAALFPGGGGLQPGGA